MNRRDGLPLPTRAEMRAWDRYAMEATGIPERVLIESAGRAAAAVVGRHFPAGRVVGVVGGGNNGADAIVLLRTLAAWGREVALIQAGDRAADPALLHGWEVEVIPPERAGAALREAWVVVDGILGTGARGCPRPDQAALIAEIIASGRPVVALDAPSGVDMDTGRAEGAAVRAELTVTFGAPKRGLLLFPGRALAGRIVVVEVGFPPLPEGGAGGWIVTREWARRRLPLLPPEAHKGMMGTVSILAGHAGMAGAAVLAGMGAARAGAGKVRLASVPENRIILQSGIPEALFLDRSREGIERSLADSDALVAGPGMGSDKEDGRLLARIVSIGEIPLLLDADALTLLSENPALRDTMHRPLLLTPHPGEMARLLDCGVTEVTSDPFAAAERAAERFRCAVLLKGRPSLVAAPGAPTLLVTAGHAGVATGGMGDTLAGVAGALLAMGSPPREAGALALYLAGRAAEIAGRGRSLLPRDVAEALPLAFAELEGDAVGSDLHSEVVLDLAPAY